MALSAGTCLGPYEIVAPLGAGGMGEVYRARDTQLGREAAVKVLPAEFARDSDRLRRFEQEARAAGSLNHPNILAVHAFGFHEGSPYLVTELLEGEPLGNVLRAGALPRRKAIEYAAQAARGLAAAHQKAIVHRDLKPANLFVTKDGRIKILDFGLAKLVEAPASPENKTSAPTVAATEPGVVLGTVGYMSPEQVRGQPVDYRSDIFSLGAILYEMLTGKRAFQGASGADTMSAILKEDPPELEDKGLQHIVQRCLEKNPEERFQSARDVGFDLEALSGTTAPVARQAAPKRRRALAWLALPVLTAAGAFFLGRHTTSAPLPEFHQVTFRRGSVISARFAPDANSILYSAQWEGKPSQVFTARLDSPESRALGLPSADVVSISATGELAIVMGRRMIVGWQSRGKLARVPLAGGAPREVLEDAQEADWDPTGTRLVVVREVEGKYRLEYPPGKTLVETTGWISHARMSPKGDRIAFIDHPWPADDTGPVAMVDLAGQKSVLTRRYGSTQGLAWAPDASEIWFTGSDLGYDRALRAVTPGGRGRVVAHVPGTLTLQDISKQGRVLVAHEKVRMGAFALPRDANGEREVSWLDGSLAFDLSPDGKTVLISEEGGGSPADYSVYIRKTDGSDAIRLGDGLCLALSPDGKWVLTHLRGQLVRLPTGAGDPVPISKHEIDSFLNGRFLRRGDRIVFTGTEKGQGIRAYLQELSAGKPRPITSDLANGLEIAISPDDRWLAARRADGQLMRYPIDGGEPQPLAGAEPTDSPIQWSQDGGGVYVVASVEAPVRIYRLDLATGKRQLTRTIVPADSVGIRAGGPVQITPDGTSYAYSYIRALSDLYVVDGWK